MLISHENVFFNDFDAILSVIFSIFGLFFIYYFRYLLSYHIHELYSISLISSNIRFKKVSSRKLDPTINNSRYYCFITEVSPPLMIDCMKLQINILGIYLNNLISNIFKKTKYWKSIHMRFKIQFLLFDHIYFNENFIPQNFWKIFWYRCGSVLWGSVVEVWVVDSWVWWVGVLFLGRVGLVWFDCVVIYSQITLIDFVDIVGSIGEEVEGGVRIAVYFLMKDMNDLVMI